MKPKTKLSPSMTLSEFDNGYWFTTELKTFAKAIGIPSASKLRKDELEKAVKVFLKTGKITRPTRRSLTVSSAKDVERGLRPGLPIRNYTNNKETKDFLEREARKISPGLKRRSGARYRLNRWREEQIVKGVRLTYGGLVKKYVQLSQATEPFAKIPHGRYINFVSDFLASDAGATIKQAINAWGKLKKLDAPKSYHSWAKIQSARPKRR